ncbi:MAG: hypothetical protein KAW14_00890 [Candidatus Aegiribacteria sp.]|nr:hypothetical protein [Candidatus Aegiribacteria sp.]
MKQNVKLIARLVRKAKKELDRNNRKEALELMKKAVSIDDNNGLVIQAIQSLDQKESAKTISWELYEEPFFNEPDEQPQAPVEERERKISMTKGDRLAKLFEASDKAFDGGHQAKAIAYLNKARKLDPDNTEVEARIDFLKTKMKAANLISLSRRNMKAGNLSEAVRFAHQAFEMMPGIDGLHELLEDIEKIDCNAASPAESTNEDNSRTESNKPYIAKIRQLVQDNSLEEAASTALKSYEDNQDDELLLQFIENFKKLGLIEK